MLTVVCSLWIVLSSVPVDLRCVLIRLCLACRRVLCWVLVKVLVRSVETWLLLCKVRLKSRVSFVATSLRRPVYRVLCSSCVVVVLVRARLAVVWILVRFATAARR